VIRSKIIWSRFTDSLYLTVDSHHGVVTLKGSATSQNAKEAAGRIALNTRDVTAVDNQLVVDTTRPTLSEAVSGSAQEVGRELADGWITTKVRSTFLYSRNVDGYEIGINTRGGVVTLKGRLDSGVQRALVIELAKNVRGVRSVDSSGLTI
jgi:osmotically-inducible protein OsmY